MPGEARIQRKCWKCPMAITATHFTISNILLSFGFLFTGQELQYPRLTVTEHCNWQYSFQKEMLNAISPRGFILYGIISSPSISALWCKNPISYAWLLLFCWPLKPQKWEKRTAATLHRENPHTWSFSFLSVCHNLSLVWSDNEPTLPWKDNAVETPYAYVCVCAMWRAWLMHMVSCTWKCFIIKIIIVIEQQNGEICVIIVTIYTRSALFTKY